MSLFTDEFFCQRQMFRFFISNHYQDNDVLLYVLKDIQFKIWNENIRKIFAFYFFF